jgi:hypothetical protein
MSYGMVTRTRHVRAAVMPRLSSYNHGSGWNSVSAVLKGLGIFFVRTLKKTPPSRPPRNHFAAVVFAW